MNRAQSLHQSVSFELLDCINFIPGDRYGYYRIRLTTAPRTIKYFRFPHERDRLVPDFRGRRLAFVTVPSGQWNCATLRVDHSTQRYDIASLNTIALHSIPKWHDRSIDVSCLQDAVAGHGDGDVQCEDKPLSSIKPCPPKFRKSVQQSRSYVGDQGQSETVFVDCTWWPTDVYAAEKETKMHARIKGQKIAPEFLAHVTENESRVIGYMTEHVPGRTAEPSDLAACQATLTRLHHLGIAYGDLNSVGFLVANDARRGVLLHSFGAARETRDARVFKDELASLKTVLDSDARNRRREQRGSRI